jgi:6-phosphogluconate dehydrogenase
MSRMCSSQFPQKVMASHAVNGSVMVCWTDSTCTTLLMHTKEGSGHYVKMVHNGIEYGDMQLIAEAYDIMKGGLGMSNKEIGDVFTKWNKGVLDSFLIEITRDIVSIQLPPNYWNFN